MDEMSMTSRGAEMTLGGVTFPVHDVKVEFKNKPRIPKTPLSFDGIKDFSFGMTNFGLGKSGFAQEASLRQLEEKKPKDAVDYRGWDAKKMLPGNWVRGLFIDYSNPFTNRYEIGCGVICARPSHLKALAEDEHYTVVHFLPEGHTGWKAMEVRHVWYYGPDRPKFDEVHAWLAPEYAAELRRISTKWVLNSVREVYGHPAPDPNERLAWLQGWPVLKAPESIINLTNIAPDDNIIAEPPAWYRPITENPCGEIPLTGVISGIDLAQPDPPQTVAAEGNSYVSGVFYENGLPTHWHCEDCGEDNNFDQHPRRCGTCRRYKP